MGFSVRGFGFRTSQSKIHPGFLRDKREAERFQTASRFFVAVVSGESDLEVPAFTVCQGFRELFSYPRCEGAGDFSSVQVLRRLKTERLRTSRNLELGIRDVGE